MHGHKHHQTTLAAFGSVESEHIPGGGVVNLFATTKICQQLSLVQI